MLVTESDVPANSTQELGNDFLVSSEVSAKVRPSGLKTQPTYVSTSHLERT
jgi:hypothetical protein